MLFSWDEKKREENWRFRKVDFAVAVGIFDDPEVLESPDVRGDYGEERIRAVGEYEGAAYLVAYTWREPETRHIITAWRLGEHGKRRYQALLARRYQGDEDKG